MKERNEVAPPCVVGVFLSSLWAVDYCDVTKEASVLLPRQTNEGKAVSNKHLRDSLTSEREMNKSLAHFGFSIRRQRAIRLKVYIYFVM